MEDKGIEFKGFLKTGEHEYTAPDGTKYIMSMDPYSIWDDPDTRTVKITILKSKKSDEKQ